MSVADVPVLMLPLITPEESQDLMRENVAAGCATYM